MANGIGTVIVQNLILDLKSEFADTTDIGAVGIIKQGRLQDDPERNHISITVHVGDPEQPDKWMDNNFARREDALDRSQFEAYAFEVGGRTSLWWRRGAVMWEFFGTATGDSQDEAQRKAGVIEARIQRAVDKSVYVPGAKDDFNEIVIEIMTITTSKSEGGGPAGSSGSYIWRGKILWQAFTARS